VRLILENAVYENRRKNRNRGLERTAAGRCRWIIRPTLSSDGIEPPEAHVRIALAWGGIISLSRHLMLRPVNE
jgi:hypothetical protein